MLYRKKQIEEIQVKDEFGQSNNREYLTKKFDENNKNLKGSNKIIERSNPKKLPSKDTRKINDSSDSKKINTNNDENDNSYSLDRSLDCSQLYLKHKENDANNSSPIKSEGTDYNSPYRKPLTNNKGMNFVISPMDKGDENS